MPSRSVLGLSAYAYQEGVSLVPAGTLGAAAWSLGDPIDPSGLSGIVVLQIMGAIAQFECAHDRRAYQGRPALPRHVPGVG